MNAVSMHTMNMSNDDFELFRVLMYNTAGINFNLTKKTLIVGRLSKRLREQNITSFKDYYDFVVRPENTFEFQRMLDVLTTHETYFFREPKHFEYLAKTIIPLLKQSHSRTKKIRIWSAASSTGEEAYSIAMVLMDLLGTNYPWEIIATDISQESLAQGHSGIYRTDRLEGVPKTYYQRYFMKGIGSKTGTVKVVPELRERVQFKQANLTQACSDVGIVDIAFLRNVLIYFDVKTKQQVINTISKQLDKQAWLFIGHSESLNGIQSSLVSEQATIYKKSA